MQARTRFLVLLLFSSLSFTCCGGRSALISTASYSALEGNWHLVGQDAFPGVPAQGPFISLAIYVSGNTIYARGNTSVACSQGSGGIGGTIGATSQIASDGTFRLSDASYPLSTLQFTIQGTAPPAGASTWQGTYAMFNSASSTSCTFNQSGSFAATPYPPFDGAYAGTITGSGLGSGVSIALQVSQGAPALSPVGSLPYVPIGGTISVSGSPCFTSGTITNGGDSVLLGDNFSASIQMNDGSTATLHGWFSDQTEKSLQAVSLIVTNGQCAGAYGSGTLTLQRS